MQCATQFVEADVMSAEELDYVAAWELFPASFSNFPYKSRARDYEIRERQQPKGRRIKLGFDFSTDQHTNWSVW
jgi:hypothetical protein